MGLAAYRPRDLCGLGDRVRPGGVLPTGLVGAGVVGETLPLADGDEETGAGDERRGDGEPTGPADGDALGLGVECRRWPARVAGVVAAPAGPCPDAPWRGAIQLRNGAVGPPPRLTATTPRHATTAIAATRPISRKRLWRRPEGSAKTEGESTRATVLVQSSQNWPYRRVHNRQ